MQTCSYPTKIRSRRKAQWIDPDILPNQGEPTEAPAPVTSDAEERLLAILRTQRAMNSLSILGLLRWSCGVLLRSRRQDILSGLVARGELVPIKDGRGEIKYHIPGLGGEHKASRPEGEGGQ